MYQGILLPTEGGEGARIVAEHAGTLAQQYGGTVHVLSVADTRNRFEGPTIGLGAEAWEETERERARQAIDAAVATLPDEVSVTHSVESGVPHSEILSYAEDTEVDLIVMGTHGRTGVDHYLIGSIAERVVRESVVPVLTVRITDV